MNREDKPVIKVGAEECLTYLIQQIFESDSELDDTLDALSEDEPEDELDLSDYVSPPNSDESEASSDTNETLSTEELVYEMFTSTEELGELQEYRQSLLLSLTSRLSTNHIIEIIEAEKWMSDSLFDEFLNEFLDKHANSDDKHAD